MTTDLGPITLRRRSSSHAAFKVACTQLRCQKGIRQSGTFFPTAARAAPKIHGHLLRCLQNKRPLSGERELWLRPGQAGGVARKFRERPAPPSPPSPMLNGMEWIGSCKINAHNSGGEETELVQHCALGGGGGGGVFLLEEKKASVVAQRPSMGSGRNGRLFCKHRNLCPARTVFCSVPHSGRFICPQWIWSLLSPGNVPLVLSMRAPWACPGQRRASPSERPRKNRSGGKCRYGARRNPTTRPAPR